MLTMSGAANNKSNATVSISENDTVVVTDENKTMQTYLKDKASECRSYLKVRGKCALTQNFKYIPAAGTDVRKTWRDYVLKELPHMKDDYQFLFRVE